MATNRVRAAGFVALILLTTACSPVPELVRLPSLAPPTPAPAIVAAMERRGEIGLRHDREWVEAVEADPGSLVVDGLRVTPAEAALLDDKRVSEAVSARQSAGLPFDEETVRIVLADPAMVIREGVIPMTPAEAAAWDRRASSQSAATRAVLAYGAQHPDEWADVYYHDGKTMVVSFTGHVAEHRAAIERLIVPGSVPIEVREVAWTKRELDALEHKIAKAGENWFARHGAFPETINNSPEENLVVVELVVTKPAPGLADLVLAHFEAPKKMRVAVRLDHPPPDLGSGTLVVQVRDASGRPVPDVRCDIEPDIPFAAGDYTMDVTDEHGECRYEGISAIGYTVRAWKGYQVGLLGTVRAVVPRDDTEMVTILVPPDA